MAKVSCSCRGTNSDCFRCGGTGFLDDAGSSARTVLPPIVAMKGLSDAGLRVPYGTVIPPARYTPPAAHKAPKAVKQVCPYCKKQFGGLDSHIWAKHRHLVQSAVARRPPQVAKPSRPSSVKPLNGVQLKLGGAIVDVLVKRPRVFGVLECSLYVSDLDKSEKFFKDVLDGQLLMSDDRMRALRVNANQILLLFSVGCSESGMETPRGNIPGHGAKGRGHVAFSIASNEIDSWRAFLKARSIEIISHVRPEQGGDSLYFRDLDGNLVELATPNIWSVRKV